MKKNPIDFFNGLPRAPIPQWTLDFFFTEWKPSFKVFCPYLLAFYPIIMWKKIAPTIYDSNAMVFLALFILSSPHFKCMDKAAILWLST